MKVSTIYRSCLMATAAILSGAAAVVALSPATSDELRPLLRAMGIISCTSGGPCQEGKNAGTGAGLEGISAKGSGVIGQTTFNSTGPSNGQAAVSGQDRSTSGIYDIGVWGASKVGIGVVGTSSSNLGVSGKSTSNSGVFGTSSSGYGVKGASTSNHGVFGTSSSGYGVEGTSTDNSGVVGSSSNGNGVEGAATNHIGVLGTSTNNIGVAGFSSAPAKIGGAGVTGDSTDATGVDGVSTNGAGVDGVSTNGTGVDGASGNGIGVHVDGGSNQNGVVLPALSVNANTTKPDLIDACNFDGPNPCRMESGQPVPQFDVAFNGDVHITGQIFTSGFCSGGCAVSPSGSEKRVRLFTPQESLPTIEDFGQGQLVGGQTYVRIDPAFAKTMDNFATYMVFITPEGDSNGLYVVNKSASGFEVRENRGGRSTLAFSYRIVAKPFGQKAARLQLITVSKQRTALTGLRTR